MASLSRSALSRDTSRLVAAGRLGVGQSGGQFFLSVSSEAHRYRIRLDTEEALYFSRFVERIAERDGLPVREGVPS
jgi:hypothetical protein